MSRSFKSVFPYCVLAPDAFSGEVKITTNLVYMIEKYLSVLCSNLLRQIVGYLTIRALFAPRNALFFDKSKNPNYHKNIT